jgi:hypothetical protein
MPNIAKLAEQAIKEAAAPAGVPDQRLVKDVFIFFHGFYGTLFSAKYATGEVDAEQKDKGILSARKVWAHELRKFERETVREAIDACKLVHQKFPPSLPEFLQFCREAQPRATYRPAVPEIPMGQALRSEYARRAREINAKHDQRAITRQTGYIELPQGLDGLKLAIANAVSAAGGDECRELLRLDRLFAPKVAA